MRPMLANIVAVINTLSISASPVATARTLARIAAPAEEKSTYLAVDEAYDIL